jgi:DNA-binding protein H-NS
MAKGAQSLAAMSIDALLALRDRIGTVLSEKTAELRRQLAELDFGARRSSRGNAKTSSRKGRKIAPKYRDPDEPSNVWAGRGAVPRWMREKIKAGAKREDFLIGSSDAPSRKKRAAGKVQKRTKRASARKKRASAQRKRAATPKQQSGAAAATNE